HLPQVVIMRSSLRCVSIRKTLRLISVSIVFILLTQPVFLIVSNAQTKNQRGAKSQAMTENQRIAHVLSRLTFGARPGDFERVKAMGVEAFINQQLDPDSVDNTAAIAKLKRLPTLGMATPVIIEQYTPPKPVVTPLPIVATPAEKTAVSSTPQIGSDRTNADKMS